MRGNETLLTGGDGRWTLECPLLGRTATYVEIFDQYPALRPLYSSVEREGLSVCFGLRVAKEGWRAALLVACLYLAFVRYAIARARPRKRSAAAGGGGAAEPCLACWNLCLCAFSVVGASRTVPHLVANIARAGYTLRPTMCSPPESMAAGAGGWGVGATGVWVQLFVASKAPELLDTAFLAYRSRPIPFIHWFHHCTVFLYAYHSYATEASHARAEYDPPVSPPPPL